MENLLDGGTLSRKKNSLLLIINASIHVIHMEENNTCKWTWIDMWIVVISSKTPPPPLLPTIHVEKTH